MSGGKSAGQGFAEYDARQFGPGELLTSTSSTALGPICWMRNEHRSPVGIFPCEPEALVVDGYSTRGFTVERAAFPHSDSGEAIVVSAVSPRSEAQFKLLLDDLVAHVLGDRRPSRKIQATLESWKELFGGDPGAPMGPNQQIGLLAELHVLERAIAVMGNDAVASWQLDEAKKAKHDFVTTAGSAEVKATQTGEALVVGIHGLEQLEPVDGPLALFAQRFENHPNGDSIDQAVRRIRDLGGIDLADFDKRLTAAGYKDEDSAHYAQHRFLTLLSKFLVVDAEFPRITSSRLRTPADAAYITGVSYRLDVGPLPGIEGDAAFDALVDHLSGGLS